MPFLYNIPQATDLLSVSQGNILTNFGILGAIAGNTNTNSSLINASAGFNFLYLPNQGAAPTFVAGTVNLWTQNNADTGNNELYVENDSTGAPIPITAAEKASPGWAYLPSGLLLKWAQATVAGAGPSTFTWPTGAIPAFTAVLTEGATPTSNISVYISGSTTLTIQITTSGAGSFNFWALGY